MTMGAQRIERALRGGAAEGRPRLVPFLCGGHPTRASFPALLASVARQADVVEIGVPFTDPMADGVSIQRASASALADGTTLPWLLDVVARLRPAAPVVLMSYLNPLLALGPDRLAREAALAGVSGFIVPDLPLEERDLLGPALDAAGLALIQLVTPLTTPERLERLCRASRGFVYAVTRTGTTGARVELPNDVATYLDRVRSLSPVPVCAGFGIRDAAQVAALSGHADGAIVGSALIDAIERGDDAARFVAELRTPHSPGAPHV
jgi:tryptophan synthase alpha chain